MKRNISEKTTKREESKMKNRKVKLLAVLVCAAIFMLSAIGITAAAAGEGAPEIVAQNIQYEGNFSMMFAVSVESASSEVRLEIYDASSTLLGTYAPKRTEMISVGERQIEAYIFITKGIAAKDMADYYYAKAVDGASESETLRASVAEYMLERLYGGYTLTEGQRALYGDVLQMGASAQRVLINEKDQDPSNDEMLVTDYVYVSVSGGNIGGFNKGVFPKGTELTLTPDDPETAVWYMTNTAGESELVEGNVAVANEHCTIAPGQDMTETVPEGAVHFNDLTDEQIAAGTSAGGGAYKTLGADVGYDIDMNIRGGEFFGLTVINKTNLSGLISKVLAVNTVATGSVGGTSCASKASDLRIGVDEISAAGNCYVFEADIMVENVVAYESGDALSMQLSFTSSSDTYNGQACWNYRHAGTSVYLQDRDKAYYGPDGSRKNINDIPLEGWYRLRVEMYMTYDDAGTFTGTRTKFYAGESFLGETDNCYTVSGAATEISNIDIFYISFYRTTNSNVYFDNIICQRIDKAYVAEG